MDIYSRRYRWKIILAIIGFVILMITMVYSNYLADKLADNEENNVQLYVAAIESIQVMDLDDNIDFESSIISELNSIPVILEDEEGNLSGHNYGGGLDSNLVYLETRKQTFLDAGKEPIKGSGYSSFVYYDKSKLYKLITLFPLVQVLLLGSFILLGYFMFSSSRRSEQNRVWAGMAKETAHQLGTPISAIIAWIEFLKESNTDNPEQLEVIGELRNDVNRLELIADRFSKIGSTPKLEKISVQEELNFCLNYMKRRASKKISFEFPDNTTPIFANINKHLFDWVIENLMRNALDAMGNEGVIKAEVFDQGLEAVILLSDTGKGIQTNKFKTVFEPGYSTKTRGWGLGLSLAKRIIENYHKGRIYVKSSRINEGTTFAIHIPKA